MTAPYRYCVEIFDPNQLFFQEVHMTFSTPLAMGSSDERIRTRLLEVDLIYVNHDDPDNQFTFVYHFLSGPDVETRGGCRSTR